MVEPQRVIGLLCGMSGRATVPYYLQLNAGIEAARGGHHAAELAMYSVNFAEIAAWIATASWAALAEYLIERARRVEAAGAEVLIISSNTVHVVADQIQAAIAIPLLHIVDVTAAALQASGVRTAALLGTGATMEAPFYRERFLRRFGIELLVPTAAERRLVDDVIFGELTRGELSTSARRAYVEILRRLRAEGARAAVLGCTEIGLLVRQPDIPELPLFDTTALHVARAVEIALHRTPLPPRMEV
jgi:aspartate racemase